MNMIFGGNPLSVGGVPVEIKGCISKIKKSSSTNLSLSASDATNGIGWYNVTLCSLYSDFYSVTGNLYFDGTYFNGCLTGMMQDYYDGINNFYYALVSVVNSSMSFSYYTMFLSPSPVTVVNAYEFPSTSQNS